MAEQSVKDFLLEWAEKYFKSRDSFNKSIVKIDKGPAQLIIAYKDRTETIQALSDLGKIGKLSDNFRIITLNNRHNIDALIERWPLLKENITLKIYFINPFSSTDTKWIINPHTHSKICDETSFRQGIISMFETVEPLTEEILKSKLSAVKS